MSSYVLNMFNNLIHKQATYEQLGLDTSLTPTLKEVFSSTPIDPSRIKSCTLFNIFELYLDTVYDLDPHHRLNNMFKEYDQLLESNPQLTQHGNYLSIYPTFNLEKLFNATKDDEKKRIEFFRVAQVISRYIPIEIYVLLKLWILDIRLNELKLFSGTISFNYREVFELCGTIYKNILTDEKTDNKSDIFVENNKKIDFILDRNSELNSTNQLFVELNILKNNSIKPFEKWNSELFERMITRINPESNDHQALIYRIRLFCEFFNNLPLGRVSYILGNENAQLNVISNILSIFAEWSLKSFWKDKHQNISVSEIDEYFDKMYHRAFDNQISDTEKGKLALEICDLFVSLVDMYHEEELLNRCLFYVLLISFSKEIGPCFPIDVGVLLLDIFIKAKSGLIMVGLGIKRLFCKCPVQQFTYLNCTGIHYSLSSNFVDYIKFNFDRFFKQYKKMGLITKPALKILIKVLLGNINSLEEKPIKDNSPFKVAYGLVSNKYAISPTSCAFTPINLYRQVKIEKHIADKKQDDVLELVRNSVKVKYEKVITSAQIDVPLPTVPKTKKQTVCGGILKPYDGQWTNQKSLHKNFLNSEDDDDEYLICGDKLGDNGCLIHSIDFLTKYYEHVNSIINDSTKTGTATLKAKDVDTEDADDAKEKDTDTECVDLNRFMEIVQSFEDIRLLQVSTKNKLKRKLEIDGDSKFDRYIGEETVPWVRCKNSGKLIEYYGPAKHRSKTVYHTNKLDITDVAPVLEPHIYEDVDLNNIAQHLIDLICISEETAESKMTTELMIDLYDLDFKELIELLSRFYGSVDTFGPGYLRVIKSFQYPLLNAFHNEISDEKSLLHKKRLLKLTNSLKLAKDFLKSVAFEHDMGILWVLMETFET